LVLLSAAALAPITLGIAMHLEHVAAAEACTMDLAAWTATPSVATPNGPAHEIVPHTLPIPVPMAEAASEHALPFAFVIDLDGPHIVLASDIDESWAHGEPRLLPGESEFSDPSVVRDVARARVPTAMLASIGRKVRVYSADGEACTARVGEPILVGEIWGELDWGATEAEGEPTPSDAKQTWEQGRKTLVAPLATDGDCGAALWARDLTLPAPAVFTRAAGPVPRAARRAVMRDPEVRDFALELRRFFTDAEGQPVEGERAIPTLSDRAVGQRWQDARGRELFTIEFTGDEFGGCGGMSPAWAAFVPSDDAGVTAPNTALDRAGDDVLAVVDLERDGKVEVLTSTWLGPLRLVEVGGADALNERASLDEVPFFGCPC